jgi:hypothetical protein
MLTFRAKTESVQIFRQNMTYSFHFLLFVSSIVVLQCATPKTPDAPAPDAPMVSLATGGCRGYCPIFEIKINQNGSCAYTPERNCDVSEPRTFQLTASELAKLKKEIAAIPYRTYPERFESTIADAPPSTLVFYEKVKAFSITGTLERPKKLQDLEETIRGFALKNGIDTRKAADPNEIPASRSTELLVQLKEEVNAGNWITTIEVGNPKLMRRMPPNNTWLIKFDNTQIKVKEMIAVLQGSTSVIKVQQNMRASDRDRD